MTTIRKTLAIATLLLASGVAHAAPPKTITYSGFLLDSGGAPVGGTSNIAFTLYDAATAGNVIWGPETITATPNGADGYFSVTLGLALFLPDAVFGSARYLGVKVGAEAEMTPRISLSSVPSSFTAVQVDWAGVQNKPVSSCGGATPYVTGIDVNGAVTCAAAPAGAAGCAAGNVLKWSGSAWSCQADDNTTYTVNAPLTMAGTAISIAAANATTNGYLTAADWNTFNGKLTTVSANTPITGNGTSGSPLTIAQANGTTPGYLSAGDWNTFNGKLGTVTASPPLSGQGTGGSPLVIAPANGSTNGYLSSGDWTVFSNKVAAVGVANNGGLVVSGSTNPALSLTTSCANNEVLRWNAALASWGCSATTTGTVTNVTGTAPISVATGSTVPLISISQAGALQPGFLTSTDWTTFNTKLTTAAVAAPLTGNGTAGSPISLAAATALQPGYLTSIDWTTFNAKQARVLGTCAAGTFMTAIDATGTPTCGTDQNTTYTAGTGLALTGTTFSIPSGTAGQVMMSTPGPAWTTISGDATLAANGALTLGATGVAAATYNNTATMHTPITVDAKGRITATGASITIAPAFSSVTGKPTTLAGYGIWDAVQLQTTTPGTAQAGNINVMGTVQASSGGGIFTNNSATGAATGVAASANFSGSGNSSYTTGVQIQTTSTTQDQYGIYNYVNHTGTTGFTRGIYNQVSTAGSGANYGIFSTITGPTGSTNYGIYSTASGGTTNYAGYFVGDVYTSGNMTVTGTLTLGYEVITSVGTPINTAVAAANFSGTSYYASGGAVAACSAGKQVIGGGCYPSGGYSSCNVNRAYPSGNGAYACGANCDNNTGTLFAYAICARIY
jgi:hypothetical protein